MDRRLLVIVLALVLQANDVPVARADELKIEATADGVRVRATDLEGNAKRLSYDEATGILVLEGTKDVPAILVRTMDGERKLIRASKITYSFKNGDFSTE